MKTRKRLIAHLLAGISMPAAPAALLAAPGDGSVGNGISLLTNPEMAQIRGKYVVDTHRVLYFGVEMASRWQTAQGQQLSGGARLGLDFSGGGTPTVSFTPTVSIVSSGRTPTRAAPTDRHIEPGGIDNVTGLGQTIQVAGDFNQASNTLGIRMLDSMPESRDSGTEAVSRTMTDNTGATASSGLDERGVMVTLSIAGQGVVQQSIRGAVIGGTGRGAHQSIRTLGDAHTISNRMQLSILMKPGNESTNLSRILGVSLSGLRGL